MRGATAWDEYDADPAASTASGTRAKRERLKRVAGAQRWVIAAVLAQVALWGCWFVLTAFGKTRGGPDGMYGISFVIGLGGAVCVFRLAHEVRGALGGYLYGIAAIVPIAGLIVTLLVNGYASDELKTHGLTPGFFGVSDAAIDNCRWVELDAVDDFEDEGW
jgi:hypothetical protein